MILYKMIKEAITYKELKSRCPMCGREFKYPKGGYEPLTCSNFDCVQKFLHPEINRARRLG